MQLNYNFTEQLATVKQKGKCMYEKSPFIFLPND